MLFCPILINSLCVTVSFIMHMNDFTSIALRECDTSVFIIISKLHHSTIWKLLMNNTKSSVIGILNRCDMTGIFHFRDSSIFPIGIAVFCTGCRCHLFEFSFPVCKLHDPSGMVGHFFKLSFFIIRVGQAAPIVCLRFFKFSIFEIGKDMPLPFRSSFRSIFPSRSNDMISVPGCSSTYPVSVSFKDSSAVFLPVSSSLPFSETVLS